MPVKDKASHMHPGLPMWACKWVPYMCPYYPRPGCGTQLPWPVEQMWRLGNRRQVLSSRGAASSRDTSSQLPDPLIITGCHCGLGDQCLTQLSQIHLVTPIPALSSPSWAKWICQQKPAWPAKEKGESPGSLESDAAGFQSQLDPKTHKGVIIGKTKRGHKGKALGTIFLWMGKRSPREGKRPA